MNAASRAICVLVSGGLDSAVLLSRSLETGQTVLPVFVKCGLRWEPAELYWLKRYLRAVRTRRLKPLQIGEWPARSLYGAHWSFSGARVPSAASRDSAVYLPGRNVMLLGCAAIIASRERIHRIAIGTLAGNPFGDASAGFFNAYGSALTQALDWRIEIVAPLARMKKAALIRRADGFPLELTFSCLAPRGRLPCGRCNKCAERRKALRKAGIENRTQLTTC